MAKTERERKSTKVESNQNSGPSLVLTLFSWPEKMSTETNFVFLGFFFCTTN